MNGKKIQLTPNENGNNLHSGPDGFEFMMWEAETKEQAVALPIITARTENRDFRETSM